MVTSENSENDKLANLVKKLGFEVYQGSVNDVLDRYYKAAKKHQPDCVVEHVIAHTADKVPSPVGVYGTSRILIERLITYLK